jgi:hypothetical protein
MRCCFGKLLLFAPGSPEGAVGSLTVAFFLLLLPDMKDFLSLKRGSCTFDQIQRS